MNHKIAFLSFCTLALCTACGNDSDPRSSDETALLSAPGPVPESWYRLPEDGPARNPGSLDTLGRSFEQILDSQAEALNALPPSPAPFLEAGGKHPPDWVPWRLALFSADLGITSNGLLGPLVFDGGRAVQAVWERKDTVPSAEKAEPIGFRAGKGKSDLMISQPLSKEQLARRLEPSIRAALATKKIRNESLFRKNVLSSAEKFNNMAWQLSTMKKTGMRFEPSGFRLEFVFGAEGEVSPGIAVGGEVSLRFDWARRESSGSVPPPSPGAALDPAAQKLAAFARGVAPDIDAAIAGDPFLKYGFKFDGVRIALGAIGEFEFGIAKASTQVIGSIEFSRSDAGGAPLSAAPATEPGEDVLLIDTSPAPEHLRYAGRTGALVAGSGNSGTVVYKLKHEKIQRGLKKALSMGSFFASHATAPRKGRWWLSELSAEYSLSLTGEAGLATLGGLAEIELTFAHLEGK